jgi:alpha,alpha-trehalase
MLEKYNVVDVDQLSGGGEYLVQDGFGWTNGVYLVFKRLQKELIGLLFLLFLKYSSYK